MNYLFMGLRVTSDIEIPEWGAFARADDAGEFDVSIVLNDAFHALAARPSLLFAHDEVEFMIATVAGYRVREGCEIQVTPEPDAGAREIRLFLLGICWGILCYQRGILLIHASVVSNGTRTLGFCGSSGAGKSSMAAALVALGYTLVSDDLCRVDFSRDDIALAYPSAARLKLWNDALDQLQPRGTGLERDYFRAEKYHVPLDATPHETPLALDALYLLEWGELGLTPWRGVAALQRAVQFATYRGDLLEPMGIANAHWERMAELVRRVRVFTLTRPKEWAALGGAIQLVKSG